MFRFKRIVSPAVALLAVVSLTACGGSSTNLVADATKVANQVSKTSFDLVARDNKFNQTILVATANTEIKVSLANQDRGTLHNFALYTDNGAKENLYRGEVFEGNKTVDDNFRAPAPGIYYFRCDVHPDAMTGTLVAK